MKYQLVVAAGCATVLLSGCSAFGVTVSGTEPTPIEQVLPSREHPQEPKLTSAAALRFDKRGLLEFDGEVLGWGSGDHDPASGADAHLTAPMLVNAARSGATLPVFLMEDSKIYNESGGRITCAQFCAHVIMRREENPQGAWHLTIHRDGADRMTLVKATPVGMQ
jgi:hypothetical protein